MKTDKYNLIMSKIRQSIREAIQKDSRCQQRISRETGISKPALCLFMQGKRGMTLERLEMLADYLGLEIDIHPRLSKKGGK